MTNKKKRKKKKSKTPGVDRTKSEPTRKRPKTAAQLNSEMHKKQQAIPYCEWLNGLKGIDFGPVRRK